MLLQIKAISILPRVLPTYAQTWVAGVQIEQVADEQMARRAGNRLQASDGIHVIFLFGRN